MKTCLLAAFADGMIGQLLDLSFVDDGHEFGLSADGTEIHIEGRGGFTVTRGTPYAGTPPEPPAVNGIPFSAAVVHEDGRVSHAGDDLCDPCKRGDHTACEGGDGLNMTGCGCYVRSEDDAHDWVSEFNGDEA